MTWIGKVGGGALGFVVGGPVGAIIGAALGHQFDRGAGVFGALGHDGFDRDGGDARVYSAADRECLFFETTFQCLGALAKADGRVSAAEIDAARAVMAEMHLRPEAVRRAIDCFTAGKAPDFPLRRRVAMLRRACRNQPELLRTFLEIQMDFILDKPAISLRERAVLLSMAEALGVARLDLVHLEAVLRARRGFRQQRPAATPGRSVDHAYRALGLTPAASDAEVKKAYRRLMNQHHPDKQAARGLPQDMLEASQERTHQIRAAYDLIREHRGGK